MGMCWKDSSQWRDTILDLLTLIVYIEVAYRYVSQKVIMNTPHGVKLD